MHTPVELDTLIAIVSDMESSVDFYRNVVGVEINQVSPYWSSFKIGRNQVGLHPAYAAHETNSGGWTLGYRVQSIAALKSHLETHNVPIEIDYHDVPGGVILQFRDPDGNILQAIERGVTVAQLLSA